MASLNAKKLVMDLLLGSKATTGYYGLPDIYANTDGLADNIYFQFTDEYRARMLTKWTGQLIKVEGEYVRHNYTVPKIIVLRSSDSEASHAIGDALGADDDLSENDALFEHFGFGAEFDESLLLIVQSAGHGPGERDDIYLGLRELIIRARPYLETNGMENVMWRNGRDSEGYQLDKSPHIVHEARATLTYINTLSWTEAQPRVLKYKGNLTGYNQGRVTVDPYSEET